MEIQVRVEAATDHNAIRRVNELAFGQPAEADLIDALRADGYVRLSMVADLNGQVAAHILFSALEIVSQQEVVEALALAPMSVLPEFQRQGVGSRLIRAALDHCQRAGHRIVIVVGHPEYYPRFGFSAERAKTLQSEYAGESFMALELVPGALNDVVGAVRYAPPFSVL